MPKLITTKHHTAAAEAFIDTLSSVANRAYMYAFIANHMPYDDENDPDAVVDNHVDTQIGAYDNMISAKYINPSTDVKLSARRINWASNTVYEAYRDTTDQFSSSFYVLAAEVSGFSVFKCLDNANEAPSTVEPTLSDTAADDDFYFTADGYLWKYMYSISAAEASKFATPSYIPVIPNANVSGNAVSGSIDVVRVTSPGNNYNSYTSGTFNDVNVGGNNLIHALEVTASGNTNFYKDSSIKITSGAGAGQIRTINQYIVAGSSRRVLINTAFSPAPTITSTYDISPAVELIGDGSGFEARAVVNATSNTINNIEIVNRGSGYTWGVVNITGNTGFVNVTSNTVITANAAVAVAVISPQGGHGSNAGKELGAKYVCSSFKFDTAEAGVKLADANEFRQIGIMRSPLLANVELTFASAVAGFSVNDTVTQTDSGATGRVISANTTFLRLSDALGFFVQGNTTYATVSLDSNTAVNSVISSVSTVTSYADPTVQLTIEMLTGSFSEDDVLTHASLVGDTTATLLYANTTYMKLTNVRGIITVSDDGIGDVRTINNDSGGSAKITASIQSDLVRNSGEVVYIENVTALPRVASESQTIKLILEF